MTSESSGGGAASSGAPGSSASIGALEPADPDSPNEDAAYTALLAAVRAHAASASTSASGPLLVTDAVGVYDAFLAALPDRIRPAYACATCRQFVERHGGLVTIGPRGEQRAWLWHAPSSVIR